jgi:hypothetical protein
MRVMPPAFMASPRYASRSSATGYHVRHYKQALVTVIECAEVARMIAAKIVGCILGDRSDIEAFEVLSAQATNSRRAAEIAA